jgi:hypothetical protein
VPTLVVDSKRPIAVIHSGAGLGSVIANHATATPSGASKSRLSPRRLLPVSDPLPSDGASSRNPSGFGSQNDSKTTARRGTESSAALDRALEAKTGCPDCGRQLPDHRAQLAGIETFLNQALGKPVHPVRDETPLLVVLRPARGDERGPEDVPPTMHGKTRRPGS